MTSLFFSHISSFVTLNSRAPVILISRASVILKSPLLSFRVNARNLSPKHYSNHPNLDLKK
jgi:hypothetical protein